MRLTTNELKRIIKEEVEKALGGGKMPDMKEKLKKLLDEFDLSHKFEEIMELIQADEPDLDRTPPWRRRVHGRNLRRAVVSDD